MGKGGGGKASHRGLSLGAPGSLEAPAGGGGQRRCAEETPSPMQGTWPSPSLSQGMAPRTVRRRPVAQAGLPGKEQRRPGRLFQLPQAHPACSLPSTNHPPRRTVLEAAS